MITRMPTAYVSQLRELLSELDRLGDTQDPSDILNGIIENLSNADEGWQRDLTML